MERHGRSSTIEVTKLLMRATLPYFNETEGLQTRHDLLGLQHWRLAHGQATCTFCVPTNSDSSLGSPSSSNMAMTSARFCRSSSRLALCGCAPGYPGA